MPRDPFESSTLTFKKCTTFATFYKKKKKKFKNADQSSQPWSAPPVLLLEEFPLARLLFHFVLLEQGVEDLQGGADVLRDDICAIIHRKPLVLVIPHQPVPGSENTEMLLPTLANKYSRNPSWEVTDREDKKSIRWKFNQCVLGGTKSQ